MERKVLEISNYRLERACKEWESAELSIRLNDPSDSIIQSYYSMFHAVRALLILENTDSRKHKALISLFNRHYVWPGKIEHEFYTMLTKAFKMMIKCEYQDFYYATREEALKQLEDAKKFLGIIQNIRIQT